MTHRIKRVALELANELNNLASNLESEAHSDKATENLLSYLERTLKNVQRINLA